MTSLLPERLRGRPFTIAEATAFGISGHRLRADDLVAPTWGVRSQSAPESPVDSCAAYAAAIAESFAFSHLTAVLLHGLPISDAMKADARTHVIRRVENGQARRRGIVGHRGLDLRGVEAVSGLPVIGLADTWVDMGELVAPGKPVGLDDLIVLGDAIALRLGSVQPLRQALEKRVRPRGRLTLLEALELIRFGAESPGETRTRLVLVRAGLPEPELNRAVISAQLAWLGRPDLRWTAQRVIIEYQGREFHSSDEARASDEVRHEGFRQDGWAVVPVWNDDIKSDEARTALVLRVADLLGVPRKSLTLGECAPRFFSDRMVELAEIRSRRLRARTSTP